MMPWFHVFVSPPMVVQGEGVPVSHHWPFAVDVSIDFAEIDAALRIQRAGAFSEEVVFDAEVVVNADGGVLQDRFDGVRRQRADGTDSAARFASSISAIEPLVTAVAMLVPLRSM